MKKLLVVILLVFTIISCKDENEENRITQLELVTKYVKGTTGNDVSYTHERDTVIINTPIALIARMVNNSYPNQTKIGYMDIKEAIKDKQYRESIVKMNKTALTAWYIDIFETLDFGYLKVRFIYGNDKTIDSPSIALDRTLSTQIVKLSKTE